MKEEHIYPVFDQIIGRKEKENRLQQKAVVLWFTGLSGSGKTTVASAVEKHLFQMGYLTQMLDGDNIRTGINNNLRFSEEDRIENIRRIAEVSKLFVNCGVITLCAFISPTNEIREMAKEIIGEENFIEIFVNTPLEICEKRDVKGLYHKARKGEIPNFTGISAPFEKPQNAMVEIDTSQKDLEECVEIVMQEILPKIKK